ncbi:MAG: S-methyl-5-thioribose-1-phosphate isomerase, partial [Draconibacterium sp.]|nr:S-methyl-5-thioribose-1-phosphate isomerase [Draconibacterium sp.]
MKIQGKQYHTIWVKEGNSAIIQVIDQRKLPFQFDIFDLKTVEDAFFAIKEMVVRGAPLIGVTAAYGMYLALLNFEGNSIEKYIIEKADYLKSSRPTAVNLAFAVDEMLDFILNKKLNSDLIENTLEKAYDLKEKEIYFGDKIGKFGLNIIEQIYEQKKETVNIL